MPRRPKKPPGFNFPIGLLRRNALSTHGRRITRKSDIFASKQPRSHAPLHTATPVRVPLYPIQYTWTSTSNAQIYSAGPRSFFYIAERDVCVP